LFIIDPIKDPSSCVSLELLSDFGVLEGEVIKLWGGIYVSIGKVKDQFSWGNPARGGLDQRLEERPHGLLHLGWL
jgi:hypothetical protein